MLDMNCRDDEAMAVVFKRPLEGKRFAALEQCSANIMVRGKNVLSNQERNSECTLLLLLSLLVAPMDLEVGTGTAETV